MKISIRFTASSMSTNRNLFLPVVLISPVLGALFPNKILFVYSEFEYNHFGKFLITNRYFAHAQFITGYHWSFRNIAGILYMVEKDCFSGLEVIKLCSCSNQPSMKELCALRGYFAPPSPPPSPASVRPNIKSCFYQFLLIGLLEQ